MIKAFLSVPSVFAFSFAVTSRALCVKKILLYGNRGRFTWVNSNHPHLGPPPSIGGGRVRKLDYIMPE